MKYIINEDQYDFLKHHRTTSREQYMKMFVNDLQKVIDINIDSILEYVNNPESNPIIYVFVSDDIGYGYGNRRYDIKIEAVIEMEYYDRRKPTRTGSLKHYISKMIEDKFGFKCGIDIELVSDNIEEDDQ